MLLKNLAEIDGKELELKAEMSDLEKILKKYDENNYGCFTFAEFMELLKFIVNRIN